MEYKRDNFLISDDPAKLNIDAICDFLSRAYWADKRPRDVIEKSIRFFQRWPVALAYIVPMVPLALHVYHGLWSATQTLALDNPRFEPWRRPVAAGVALVLAAGNISMPIPVMAGIVK